MLPVLFVAHGSPLLALEPGAWGAALGAFAQGLDGVRAVLALSAHWEAPGPVRVTTAARPGVLHDFHGFPEALHRMDYSSPGAPELAAYVLSTLQARGIPALGDPTRALDHGVWVPLRSLFPAAQHPVLQVSLPLPRSAASRVALGHALAPLRQEGFLILASGGIVHNLRALDWRHQAGPEPWAVAFEAWVTDHLAAGSTDAMLASLDRAPHHARAVPTPEHLDPLLVALGAAEGAPAHTLFQGWQHGSLSLHSWVWD